MLQNVSRAIQDRINCGKIPEDLRMEIIGAYREFSDKVNLTTPEVAVRSSATAEDFTRGIFCWTTGYLFAHKWR